MLVRIRWSISTGIDSRPTGMGWCAMGTIVMVLEAD
jgi:hypothetical protein